MSDPRHWTGFSLTELAERLRDLAEQAEQADKLGGGTSFLFDHSRGEHIAADRLWRLLDEELAK